MANSVVNIVYMVNGHLVQLDEMLVKQAMAHGESSPEPEPGSSLPPFTIRCKFYPGHTPNSGDSQELVDDINNVWDITKNSNDWEQFFTYQDKVTLLEVLDANTSSVTNMKQMFDGCTSLTSIPLLDTSNVTTMSSMFHGCTALTSIPLVDTSLVTDMFGMFNGCTSLTSIPVFNTKSVTTMRCMLQTCTSLTYVPLFDTSSVTDVSCICEGCVNVESGALALYQALSPRISSTRMCRMAFSRCGENTTTGQAELAQIPYVWGGTADV